MPSSFDSLPLRPELLQALVQVDYTVMTPIQAAALPLMLQGKDLTGHAKTGSGKTAAFGLALLNGLDPALREIQAMVLCPTRELAEQVAGELRRLSGRMHNLRVLPVCGGHGMRHQTQALRSGPQVVVGTPGRVLKHIELGNLELQALKVLVLDEADRMLDMGFVEQVAQIVYACPSARQTLLFSATFPEQIQRLSQQVQHQPEHVSVEKQVEAHLLKQLVFECSPAARNQLLVDLLSHYRPETSLVFCETRADCARLARFLSGRGAVALALHGQLEQRERDDVLVQFLGGSASILVATNVAARGLDIPALPAVIIAELSPEPESHQHRIGRTGRAGQAGLALSVVCGGREHARLDRIEEFMGQSIERAPHPPSGGGLAFLTPPNRTLMLFSGRKDKLRKGDVVGALVKEAGLPPSAIGNITLSHSSCAVAIERAYAQQALTWTKGGRIKKRRVRARLLG